MRILVTGSRTWQRRDVIHAALRVAPAGSTVVHGAARGADTIADTVAKSLGLHVEDYPADWKRYGKAAGPIRNSAMVKLGANVCLAFSYDPERGGTGDCVRKARRAGIPVFVFPVPNDWPDRLARQGDLFDGG